MVEVTTFFRNIVFGFVTYLVGTPIALVVFLKRTLPLWLSCSNTNARRFPRNAKVKKVQDIDRSDEVVPFDDPVDIEAQNLENKTEEEILRDPKLGKHLYLDIGNDITIHAVAKGNTDNPLVLFLHGFPDNWWGWRNYVQHYSQTHYAVAIDMRGYGGMDPTESSCPTRKSAYTLEVLSHDVKKVVEKLGYKKCTLVSHDWGSIVAWTTAALYPDLVEKMVIMNVPNLMVIHDLTAPLMQYLRSWYIFMFNIPYFGLWYLRAGDFWYLDNLMLTHPKAFDELDNRVYRYHLTKNNPHNFKTMMRCYQNMLVPGPKYNTRSALRKKYQMPTLIIWGMKDKFFANKGIFRNCCKRIAKDKLSTATFFGCKSFRAVRKVR